MQYAQLVVIAVALIAQSSVLQPSLQTASVPNDADDPAIWIHPTDPTRSVVLGTDKVRGSGGLFVFDLNGALRQSITGLDRPNNVDVAYGLTDGVTRMDIAVVTERLAQRLRIYAIEDGQLRDVAPGGVPVLEGQNGERAHPMGIALYERPGDGAVFAIVAPKAGGRTDYLWQYRLHLANGIVTGTFVRRFGNFSGRGEIEAVAVDDALGFVYYSDENEGIHKWHADPDQPGAAQELALFGTSGYSGDREGLGIYTNPDGTGYLLSADQSSGSSRLFVYARTGNNPLLTTIATSADNTDGIEVTSKPVPVFPAGFVVMMNSRAKNYQVYDWRNVLATQTGR